MFGTVKLAYPVNAFLIVVILMTSQSFMTANATPGTGTLFATNPELQELLKTVDPSIGVFTPVGTTMDEDLVEVRLPSLAVDPFGGIMYGGSGGCTTATAKLYKVDTGTAGLTAVGLTGEGNIVGLDFRSNGVLYAAMNPGGCDPIGGSQLATINTGTGAASLIGPFHLIDDTVVDRLGAIAFAPDGTLWGATEDQALYTIDLGTGLVTFVADIVDSAGSGIHVRAIQFDCNGILYAGGPSGDGGFGTINTENGLFTPISSPGRIGALAFQDNCGTAVGGTIMPVDMTALLLAGIFTNAFWILSALAVVASTAFGVLYFKPKRN